MRSCLVGILIHISITSGQENHQDMLPLRDAPLFSTMLHQVVKSEANPALCPSLFTAKIRHDIILGQRVGSRARKTIRVVEPGTT